VSGFVVFGGWNVSAGRPSTATTLERCASDLHAVAFDFHEPRTSQRQSDRLIEEVERICTAARAAVRGPAR
jgi:predicted TIM-barrel fold metal-dependent hydrolase